VPPERKPLISLPRNQFIALVVGVCVLSAAIGSGLALLAQTGPHGPAGKQGPRGPAGESAGEELGEAEGEVEELRGEVEEAGGESAQVGELEERVEGLEEELESFTGLGAEICEEEGLIC
jgi:hypothetical protein